MLGNNEKINYVKTYGGRFYIETAKGDTTAKTRTTDTGREIWYHDYDFIQGRITGIQTSRREYDGKVYRNLNLKIEDGPEKNIVQLNLTGNAARCFFCMMENIDFAKPEKLTIMREGERDSLFISQDDTSLTWVYTKDRPGEKPPWKKVTIRGEEAWDNSDEIDYFIETLNTTILPRIDAAQQESNNIVEDEFPTIEPPEAATPPPDDPPF